jgi:hypothetical protein
VDVLRWVSDSDLLADVVFTIGSNPTDLANFVQTARTNPRKAMQYVTRVEGLIQEELSADGKEAAKAPEPKKTQAPKPPSPVGGGSSRGFDVSDETLSADEWARKRNAQLARRNKA